MTIHQFEDKGLAHYSYAILSEGAITLVDPERNPEPYYDFAIQNKATIKAVIETHPHADFISSHAEINRKTGAVIYASNLLSGDYPHQSFDEGDAFQVGNVTFKALNTPGHSPDSICIVAYENGTPEAVFTGDTLFIGDCGRPDLREKAGALTAAREQLARSMYHSLREKLASLPDDVKVYPTHGAGSLCGRGLSSQNVSTIGAEKATNWSLQPATEDEFVKELLTNQPFVPKYFTNSVALNRKGAPDYAPGIQKVEVKTGIPEGYDQNSLIIDTRSASDYRAGFLSNSINLMEGGKFETWLGSIVAPGERFYLLATSREKADALLSRIARIGYESQVASVWIVSTVNGANLSDLNLDNFRNDPEAYTIIDVRNQSEVASGKIFKNAFAIPLPELRERVAEIPTGKPVVVHCAAGYRSAAGVSIVKSALNGNVPVYDLGEAINDFK